jgi:hypothetical protein
MKSSEEHMKKELRRLQEVHNKYQKTWRENEKAAALLGEIVNKNDVKIVELLQQLDKAMTKRDEAMKAMQLHSTWMKFSRSQINMTSADIKAIQIQMK